MIQDEIPELAIPKNVSQPFSFTFELMYIGITGVIAYLNGLARCDNRLWIGGNIELGFLLLLLLSLSWFERRIERLAAPSLWDFILLGIRIALFEGIVALDCTGVALFLYPIVPFNAFFKFGGKVSLLLSLFYVVLTIWRTGLMDSTWYLDVEVTSDLLSFAFVMLFVPLIAYVIRRDEQSRQRTEKLLVDLAISHLKSQVYAEQVAELAAVEERNRLARDIHDSLGHYLTAVNIQLEKALVYQDHNPDEAVQAIRDAKEAAATALRDVRRSVSTLRDPNAHFSLQTALQDLVDSIDSNQLSVEFSMSGDEQKYSPSVLMVLYRAAQEGLTNTCKHAQATHVTLAIQLGEDTAILRLRDDGHGFDPQALEKVMVMQSQSFGLRGIRERLELVRGRLVLNSSPHQGTELVITVPRQLPRLNTNE